MCNNYVSSYQVISFFLGQGETVESFHARKNQTVAHVLTMFALVQSLPCIVIHSLQLAHSEDPTWCLLSLWTLFVAYPLLSSILDILIFLVNYLLPQ